MKIGFDVSDLCTSRADGTTRYTRELVKRLPELDQEHYWYMFAPCDMREKVKSQKSKVKTIASPWPGWWTQTRLSFDLLRFRPDVMFMPIQQVPYLRPGKMKTVAVVHDLAVHLYPKQFRFKDWLLLHVFSAQAVREADDIIAVSQATAEDIARFYGREKRVHVIHHGVDHQRFKVSTGEIRIQALKKPYLLYVGQLQPRKNLVRLIGAFERLKGSRPDLQLVIAGGHGWLKRPILEAIKRSSVANDIVTPGIVPDEMLPALYSQAEAFVLPSLYEGFGMPLLEAFACGCPVVTSNVSSMPEVAGGAAVLVNPTDTDSIASGIKEALSRRQELRQLGLARAKQFDWDTTSRQVLEVLLWVK